MEREWSQALGRRPAGGSGMCARKDDAPIFKGRSALG